MRVRIKVRNEGVRHNPFWWMIVQPVKKSLKGKHLERIGYWLPRTKRTYDRAIIINKHRLKYWISVGAELTPKVQKLLEHHDFVPKKPMVHGSKYSYEKPEKDYKKHWYRYFDRFTGGVDEKTWIRARIQEQINLKKRKELLTKEAIAQLGEQTQAVEYEEMPTEEIESEEEDIFERKRKFDALVKKFEKHKLEKSYLKGNDMKYNLYLNKIGKLAKQNVKVDAEAYKNFINDQVAYRDLNQEFQVLVEEQDFNIKDRNQRYWEGKHIDWREKKEVIQIVDPDTKFTLINMFGKLQRPGASFFTRRERDTLEEFLQNGREWLLDKEIMLASRDLFQHVKLQEYQEELRKYTDLDKISDAELQELKITPEEFTQIQLLNAELGPRLFYEEDQRFQDNHRILKASKELKAIFYRPPVLKKLKEKYWQITNFIENRDQDFVISEQTAQENKQKLRLGDIIHEKTEKELKIKQKVIEYIDKIIREDAKLFVREEEHEKKLASLSDIEAKINLDQRDYEKRIDKVINSFFYPLGQPVEHDIEGMNPNDPHHLGITTKEVAMNDQFTLQHLFLANNVNLAKFYYGKDGGYSEERLARMLERARQMHTQMFKDREWEEMEKRRILYGEEVQEEEAETKENEAEQSKEEDAPEKQTKKEEVDTGAGETLFSVIMDSNADPNIVKFFGNPDQPINGERDASEEEFERLDREAKTAELEALKARADELDGQEISFNKFLNKKVKQNELQNNYLKQKEENRKRTEPLWHYPKQVKEQEVADSWHDEIFINTKQQMHNLLEKDQENLGRYVYGWRHFENFEFYSLKFPKATVEDYKKEMNRQATVDEFTSLSRDYYMQMTSHPLFKMQFKEFLIKQGAENTDLNDALEAYFLSPDFVQEAENLYMQRVSECLSEGKTYSLVECLEDFTSKESMADYKDLNNIFKVNTGQVFVPPRHHILKRPDFSMDHVDDLGIRKLEKRFSHAKPEDTLAHVEFASEYKEFKVLRPNAGKHRWLKNRKLATTPNRRVKAMGRPFSTTIERPNAQEYLDQQCERFSQFWV